MLKNKSLIIKQMRFPFIIFIVAFSLYSIGIKWGLPTSERKNLIIIIENEQEILELIQNFSEEEEWQSSHQNVMTNNDIRFILNTIRTYHPDEQYVLKSLASMNPSKFDFDPKFYVYPAFLTYLTGFLLQILSFVNIVSIRSDISFYYKYPEEFAKLYLVGRLLCISFGAGISVIIYYISKLLFNNKKIVFFSVILTILLPINFYWSNFLLPDVPTTFFLLFTLYFSIRLYYSNKYINYILTGLLAGLSISTKYTGAPIVVIIFLGHFLNKNNSIINLKIILTYIIMGSIFIIINPYMIFSYESFFYDISTIKSVKESGWGYNSYMIGPMFIYIFKTLIYNGNGLLYLICSIFCLIFHIFKLKKPELIYLSYFFLFYFILSTSAYVAYHYIVIFLPILNIIISKILIKYLKKIGVIILILIAINFSIYNIIYAKVFINYDSRLDTGKWIANNIKKKSIIGYRQGENIAFNSPPINVYNYQMKIYKNLEDIQKLPPEFFILSNYSYRHFYRLKENMPFEDYLFYDYIFNSNDYKIIYENKYDISYINKTLDITDSMVHIIPEFIIFQKNEK